MQLRVPFTFNPYICYAWVMAIFYTQRSSYLSDTQIKHHKASKILIYAFLIGTAFIAAILLTAFQKNGLFVLIILLGVAFSVGYKVFREGYRDSKKYLRKERNYASGYLGEELVENELRKLPDTFHVFCDLVIQGNRGNLDFVVVGPNAIFLIDVKNSIGRVYNNSRKGVYSGKFGMNYIPVMQKEVLKLDEYLRGPLQKYSLVPVLLFSNKKAYVAVKQPVELINVLHIRQLNNFLLNHTGISHDVNRIVEVLRPLAFRFE